MYGCDCHIGCLSGEVKRIGTSIDGSVSRIGVSLCGEVYRVGVDAPTQGLKGWVSMVCSVSTPLYRFVDLGLPSGTLWADRNVGASSEEGSGLFFAWGETKGYTKEDVEKGVKVFSWGDYRFSVDGSRNNFSKYNDEDGLAKLEYADDAAYLTDNSCRMPTANELSEMMWETISTVDIVNGVQGMRFTSRTNGNSIFIPTLGVGYNGAVSGVGVRGCYWTNELDEEDYSWHGEIYSSPPLMIDMMSDSRCMGMNIRPVSKQYGMREVFLPSDGEFILADGGTFNVLKYEL